MFSRWHASPRGKIGIGLWKPEPSQATTTKPGTIDKEKIRGYPLLLHEAIWTKTEGGGGNNNSPVPTFGNRFSSEMVFGDPKPDLFSRWRGDKREVSRMDIP